jgi:hypothetical protein
VVAHDTTELRFSGERTQLGRLATDDYGFLAHVAVAMTARRVPLGLVGLRTHFRKHGTRRRKHSERRPIAQRESARWIDLMRAVEERLAGRATAIHVMDREADFYELLAVAVESGWRFVIRMQFDRTTELSTIVEEITAAPAKMARDVELSARPLAKSPRKARRHPPRATRTGHLKASAKRVIIHRPHHVDPALAEAITVNVVRVFEVGAPDGCEPVEWILLTTEPIDSGADISRVIDSYCSRWLIEEYFKVLKTGCAFEKRQLENRHAVLNALALLAPVAWRLLLLRTLAHEKSNARASEVLTSLQLRILQRHERTRLGPDAKVWEAMLAIAALGGHIKNNGPPGWQVLGRGFEDLLLMERGAALAKM